MSGLNIPIIIDKKAKLQKPINNRPGYDMKYIKSYIYKYFGINDYQQFFDKLFEIERQYDTLSVIRPNETPQQWAIRVRIPLQELVSEKKRSVYHIHYLYGGFGNSKLVNHDYYRPRIYETHMAICLDCWKLIQVNDVKPKKVYASAIYRYIEKIEPADLIKYHWDHECNNPKSQDGYARIIQTAYRRFKERVPSNARLAWLSLPNDNIPDDKKFLGLTTCKVKNPQTRDQFNQWRAEQIAMYERCNSPQMLSYFYNSKYEEYYIPYDWIGRKKNQLRDRFSKRLQQLEV